MNDRQFAKLFTYGRIYGASPSTLNKLLFAPDAVPNLVEFDMAAAEARFAELLMKPVEEHGPEERVVLSFILPFEWREATAAFKDTTGVTLTDIALAACNRYISATMSMYRALKEARQCGAQPVNDTPDSSTSSTSPSAT